ncbi:MAG TPA: UDP-N-acetylmuramoyl-tripeptide--D-alanyl-D-alanine ligase [Ktedonobacteraceae bacterium]|nr:UDP-N-acetylmuramoyl-tripeptide--D-alanyl-D-alanine ligase [Ktedonobacteraceae bacterium]
MFTLNDLLQGNENKAHTHSSKTLDPNQVFPSAQHDSRQVKRGDLFIAIKGAHVDGHCYIPEVARAGAGAVLCSQPSDEVPPDFLQLVVPDVVQALHNTARVRVQRQENTLLIGITGSNGKTSTKDAVAAILQRQAPTLKTFASYNNEIGYPLTLLRLEPGHRFAALEMGAQWVGELTWLCETIARPDWSIITNVGAAHLEYFGSQERVIIAKSELVQALTTDGIAILNYDDINVRGMAAKTRAEKLFYGLSQEAEVRGSDIHGESLLGLHFTLHYADQHNHIQLHLPGVHGVMTALAAAAVGCAAQMNFDDVCAALESLQPAKGRGEIKPGPNGSTLIDDTYNANRQSIVAMVTAMGKTNLPANGKRWAVLGDIFELGQYAPDEHRASGKSLVGIIDYLIAIGNEARYFVEGAIEARMPENNIHYFHADVENAKELEAAKQAAADVLTREVHSEDLVLIKGSRGMRMETMLPMLS